MRGFTGRSPPGSAQGAALRPLQAGQQRMAHRTLGQLGSKAGAQVVLHAQQQVGGGLGIGERAVGAAAVGQRVQLRERAQPVVRRLGVEAARQQQGAGKRMGPVLVAAGAGALGLPEAAVEGGVVRHQRAAGGEVEHLAHHPLGRRRALQHAVADAGELLDERRHPGAAVHQALVAAHDLPAAHQHRGDLGGARALAGRDAGGFEVDDGDGFHAVAAASVARTGASAAVRRRHAPSSYSAGAQRSVQPNVVFSFPP